MLSKALKETTQTKEISSQIKIQQDLYPRPVVVLSTWQHWDPKHASPL